MVAERAGECFVRAVIRLQRERQNIGSAAGKRARRFAQASGAHVTHNRQSSRRGERPDHMEARHPTDRRDLVEGQRVGKMTFDKPERPLGRIHKQQPSFEASAS